MPDRPILAPQNFSDISLPNQKPDSFVAMDYEPTTQSIFFYGLFMDQDLLWQKGLDPMDFKLACVEGYGLRISERATLEISKTEEVFGSIVKLSAEEIEQLYGEQSVADYIPKLLTATDMEGNRIAAISYILPMELLSGHNPEYARALLLAAGKIGLPDTYLKTIEALI